MPLAPYFRRSAVATAQVLDGYDEEAIKARLEDVSVGLSISPDALATREGRSLADLTVRLLGRLYPRLCLPGLPSDTRELAARINPDVEIVDAAPDYLVVIGDAPDHSSRPFFVGSNGWDGAISSVGPLQTGDSSNPIGAGIAACLAAARIFRAVFLDEADAVDEPPQTLSGLYLSPGRTSVDLSLEEAVLLSPAVLVGGGAIGNGAIWALARSTLRGELIIVDPETLELSNVQRYVLTDPSMVGKRKVEIALSALQGNLRGEAVLQTWQDFVSERGGEWSHVLVGLDSARDRRSVQASLPQWIANAWTQPGDLGVSVHPWTETGACLSCLYLPAGEVPSEDKLIAAALGLSRPDIEGQIRQILWANGSAPRAMLEQAAAALSVPLDDLLVFENRPLRELYVEGICGGAVVPLNRVGRPTQDIHVPLAHQSALAGVLLAGRLLARSVGAAPEDTSVTRIDVLRPLSEFLTQPMQKDTRGICICQDPVYRDAYELKWADVRS